MKRFAVFALATTLVLGVMFSTVKLCIPKPRPSVFLHGRPRTGPLQWSPPNPLAVSKAFATSLQAGSINASVSGASLVLSTIWRSKMKTRGKRSGHLTATTPETQTPAEALKIVQALQSFVANTENAAGLSEAELAGLGDLIKEEISTDASAKTAKKWAKRLRTYAGLEDSRRSKEFFEQLTDWTDSKKQAKDQRSLAARSGRSA
jgi:hypothetical protein